MKIRKRKFKLRVTNKRIIRNCSFRKGSPNHPTRYGVRVDHACRLKFTTLIGSEKSIMVTKNKIKIYYKMYPNFFVTKKASKARMGKGKGKIVGRILKIHKGETLFNVKLSNPLKSKRWIKAIKGTLPSTSRLVRLSTHATAITSNFYRSRPWVSFKPKKKKRPFWMIKARKYRPLYDFITSRSDMDPSWRDLSYYCRRPLLPVGRKSDNKLFRIYSKAKLFSIFLPRSGRPYGPILGKRLIKSSNFYSGPAKAISGSKGRGLYLRKRVVATYTKRMYENFIACDEDGYYGLSRYMNLIIKRKRLAYLNKKHIDVD